MKKVFLFLASCLVAFAASATTYSVTIKNSDLEWKENSVGEMEARIPLPSTIEYLGYDDEIKLTFTGGSSNIPFYKVLIVDNGYEEYNWWHELTDNNDFLEVNTSGNAVSTIPILDGAYGYIKYWDDNGERIAEGSYSIRVCLTYPKKYTDFVKNGLLYSIKGNNSVCLYRVSNQFSLSELSIPQTVSFKGTTYNVTSIGDNAFNYRFCEGENYMFESFYYKLCKTLTSVTIPQSVTSIGNGAFSYCENLTSIAIPNSVTSIGDNAFYACENLTSVTIPQSVTSIGSGTFYNCNLVSINIPESVTSIGNNAFGANLGVALVTFPENLDVSNAGIRFSTAELSFFVINNKEVAIIGASKDIASLVIPNTVNVGNTFTITSIGGSAFSGCTGLTSIVIPNSVTYIGSYAFYNCTNLTSIVIPNNVNSIGDNAFSGCTNLKNAIIGENVESIGSSAFGGCSSLSKITCYAVEPPTVDVSTFSNYNGYLTIPCDNFDSYDIHAVWGTFKHVDCISAESVDIEKDEVVVEPDVAKAAFSMPIYESANSYTLTIQNNGVTFCTISFNANGQLTNIDFSTTKSYELKSDVAAYQFTVTGLSAATDYGYSFKALNKSKAVLKEYSGTFTTKNEDGTGGSVQGGSEGSGQGGQETETAIDGVSNANAVTIVSNQILVNDEAPAFVVTVSGKK
ncbi:MAG: leucine-rich repeat protein, partial [Bacteroidales bacterium]|nr:leucine-rich repeat protein [Bacteroidales bacterium]